MTTSFHGINFRNGSPTTYKWFFFAQGGDSDEYGLFFYSCLPCIVNENVGRLAEMAGKSNVGKFEMELAPSPTSAV